MLRAGDVNGGLRELRAFVDANPGNRAARQRIGAAVADRARELESKGSREQALPALRAGGRAARRSHARVDRADAGAAQGAVRRVLRQRANARTAPTSALAIKQWETSLRYDPQNLKAAARLRDARAAQEKLKKHRAREIASGYFAAAAARRARRRTSRSSSS